MLSNLLSFFLMGTISQCSACIPKECNACAQHVPKLKCTHFCVYESSSCRKISAFLSKLYTKENNLRSLHAQKRSQHLLDYDFHCTVAIAAALNIPYVKCISPKSKNVQLPFHIFLPSSCLSPSSCLHVTYILQCKICDF